MSYEQPQRDRQTKKRKREKFSCLGYHFVHVTDFLTISWPLQHSRLSSFLLFLLPFPTQYTGYLEDRIELTVHFSFFLTSRIKPIESFFLYQSIVIIFASHPEPHNLFCCLGVLIYYCMIYCFIYLIGCFVFELFIFNMIYQGRSEKVSSICIVFPQPAQTATVPVYFFSGLCSGTIFLIYFFRQEFL